MDAIRTRQLTKTFGKHRAVDALDMRVGSGDIYGLVGKNGAGKSTAMKMIARLMRPTSGELELFGKAVLGTGRPKVDLAGTPSRIGALIENPGILNSHSVRDNLIIKALAVGELKPAEHADELLELVGLGGAARKKAKSLSLGMKQRLGLALALVGHPDLLLLDEPFNGLDPEATRAMRSTLTEINRERGVTILISSHVLDQLNRVATRFGVIRDGRMVRELTAEELHDQCGSSIRVRVSDPARALVVLEERMPTAQIRVDPTQAIIISLAAQGQRADARFGGSGANPANAGDPTVELVSQTFFDAGIPILELSLLERDIEDYFVDLMGGADAAAQEGA